MTAIQVLDPALGCRTGVDYVDVDRAKQRGAQIVLYNLAQQPLAFAETPVAKGFSGGSGSEALPLLLVDGEIARYPSRNELASWAEIDDPQGIAWEAFLVLNRMPMFGDDDAIQLKSLPALG